MRPTLAEAGCPYCGRQMVGLWPASVAWECWQVTARDPDWAASFVALGDVLLATTPLPQDKGGPRWLCPDCEVVDWATEDQPDCLECGEAMWWAADWEDRSKE
jgi:hypothetical protein